MLLGVANELIKKHKINRMKILPYAQRKTLFPNSKKQKVDKNFFLENFECFLYIAKILSLSPLTIDVQNVETDTLREKCPNSELFLLRIFLYSDQK